MELHENISFIGESSLASRKAPTPLISCHLPKTAGTTFAFLLRRAFGNGFIFVNDPRTYIHSKFIRTRCRHFDDLRQTIPSYITCIHGHFSVTAFDHILPSARKSIWFREPIQRMASYYFHLRRNSMWFRYSGWAWLPPQVGVTLFLRSGFLNNVYRNIIISQRLKNFNFVGITEQFDRSIALFEKVFELKLNYKSELLNSNLEKVDDQYPMPPRLWKYAKQRYRNEVGAYAIAVQRFENLCRQFGV